MKFNVPGKLVVPRINRNNEVENTGYMNLRLPRYGIILSYEVTSGTELIVSIFMVPVWGNQVEYVSLSIIVVVLGYAYSVFIQLRLHTAGLPNLILRPPRWDPLRLFLVGLSAPMVQVGKDITWQDSLILENEVTVLNNVLYGDLTGVFLVVGCTLFISLVNCLSEISCLDSLINNFFYLIPCLHQFR